MWAGVQNVSLPIERCQETSQCAPMETEVTASTAHHKYHGIERADAECLPSPTSSGVFQVVAIEFSSAIILRGLEKSRNPQFTGRLDAISGQPDLERLYSLIYHYPIIPVPIRVRPGVSTLQQERPKNCYSPSPGARAESRSSCHFSPLSSFAQPIAALPRLRKRSSRPQVALSAPLLVHLLPARSLNSNLQAEN